MRTKREPGWWRNEPRAAVKPARAKSLRPVRIEKFFTVDEVAKILRRHPDSVYDLIRERELAAIRDGSRYLIGESAVLERLQSCAL